MSKIGRKPIIVPEGVEVKIDGQQVSVKGSKGELKRQIHDVIKVEQKDQKIFVTLPKETIESRKLWGLERSLIQNMVIGVSQGFIRKLEVNGVGYRAAVQGKKINLELGFSHPIELDIPEGVEVQVKKNIIELSSIDKQLVGQFASDLRRLRPPEPYKGKGIKYLEEQIRRKEGKKAAATEGEAAA